MQCSCSGSSSPAFRRSVGRGQRLELQVATIPPCISIALVYISQGDGIVQVVNLRSGSRSICRAIAQGSKFAVQWPMIYHVKGCEQQMNDKCNTNARKWGNLGILTGRHVWGFQLLKWRERGHGGADGRVERERLREWDFPGALNRGRRRRGGI